MSWLLSLSHWDWADVAGVAMVFAGVAGGYLLRCRKALPNPEASDLEPVRLSKGRAIAGRKRWEHAWEGFLILGLGLEIVSLGHHISESATIKKETAQLKVKAEALEKTNEVLRLKSIELTKETEQLRATNLVLEAQAGEVLEQLYTFRQNVPKLTEAEIRSFTNMMAETTYMRVSVIVGIAKRESQEIHDELVRVFSAGPWPFTNRVSVALSTEHTHPKLHLLIITKRRVPDGPWEFLNNRLFRRLQLLRRWTTLDSLGERDLIIVVRPTPPFDH